MQLNIWIKSCLYCGWRSQRQLIKYFIKSWLHLDSNAIYELINISIKSCLRRDLWDNRHQSNIGIKNAFRSFWKGDKQEIKYFNQKVCYLTIEEITNFHLNILAKSCLYRGWRDNRHDIKYLSRKIYILNENVIDRLLLFSSNFVFSVVKHETVTSLNISVKKLFTSWLKRY
jgi:hypothetical protein